MLRVEPGTEALGSGLRSDRGEVPTMFVMLSLTMVLFFLTLHMAVVMHGKSALAAAAQDGLAAAQLKDGTEAEGEIAIRQTLQLADNVEVLDYGVRIIDDTTVEAWAEGVVETGLIEVFNRFRVEVEGPKERFYTEAERR